MVCFLQAVVALESSHPYLSPLCPSDIASQDQVTSQHPLYPTLLRVKAPLVYHMLSSLVGHDRARSAVQQLVKYSVRALTAAVSGADPRELPLAGIDSPAKGLSRSFSDDMPLDSPTPLVRADSEGGEGELETRSLVGGLTTASFLEVVGAMAGGDMSTAVQHFARQWVYGSGFAVLRFSYYLKTQSNTARFVVEQDVLASGNRIFSGPVKIVITEQKDIEEPSPELNNNSIAVRARCGLRLVEWLCVWLCVCLEMGSCLLLVSGRGLAAGLFVEPR